MNNLRTLVNPFQYNEMDIRIVVDSLNNIFFSANDVCCVLDIDLNNDTLANINNKKQSIEVTLDDSDERILFIDTLALYKIISSVVSVKGNAFNKWISAVVIPGLKNNGLLD